MNTRRVEVELTSELLEYFSYIPDDELGAVLLSLIKKGLESHLGKSSNTNEQLVSMIVERIKGMGVPVAIKTDAGTVMAEPEESVIQQEPVAIIDVSDLLSDDLMGFEDLIK